MGTSSTPRPKSSKQTTVTSATMEQAASTTCGRPTEIMEKNLSALQEVAVEP